VPERLNVLLRQRNRWHRGLIENLTFHRAMLLNPRYRQTGLIAFPYFFLFEMIGPWIELQGYGMVLAAIAKGLLNSTIALWLLCATIMLGTFVSIASLIIAEQEVNYFSVGEVFKLIGYAVIENFWLRQLLSVYRVKAFVNALQKKSVWGAMQRKGFKKTA
jgi:cellulose synthase/poly-beta-1,6-N-acetylglucosamine synthase-like glycosyltransferase